ncbi:hypothetical protein [Micromonospora sp. DT233]|uniref:hypothetical protein n=1 Tax=Micromonospora sp. DT233 TaxID=3393432 RepID=UPI003CED44D6
MNDVYVPLSDLVQNEAKYLNSAAARCLSFAARMLRDAATLPGAESLLTIVSVFVDEEDEEFFLQGANVRFFSRRGDYPNWFEDLGRYQKEAIAVVDIADLAEFGSLP